MKPKCQEGKSIYNSPTDRWPVGVEYVDISTGRTVGILAQTVGPYGESTGIFQMMKTTCPEEVIEIL
jgi:hypothetical protein